MTGRPKSKAGAALVESCLVIIMLCLILFGMLQVSYLIGARDVIAYASVGVARSASVGFDDFMLYKAARMFTIPTAGPMLVPGVSSSRGGSSGYRQGELWDRAVENVPENEQYWTEKALIPFFLGAESPAEARAVLNYENWEVAATRVRSPELHGQDTLSERILDVPVMQYVPMVMPFARVFYRKNVYDTYRNNAGGLAQNSFVGAPTYFEVPHVFMRESAGMENHAAYYMTNGTWTVP